MTRKLYIALLSLSCLAATTRVVAGDISGFTIDDIAWLAGSWKGVGPDDYSGKEQVIAIWTAPVEGVMSWTFRYHTPEDGHVHFAFTVIEAADGDVFSRGMHHGRDFETYEDRNWVFRLQSVTQSSAVFSCVSDCRGIKSLSFELKPDGTLLETYELNDPNAELSVFRYRRLPN